MTNWEYYFGTPEAAMRMEVEFYAIPAMVIVKHEELAGNTATLRGRGALLLERRLPGMAQGGEGGGRVRNVNWGCLLFLAFVAAVDVLAFMGFRALAAWLVGA